MPDLLFFVPSESCSIDAGSNRVSIFHVCEQLNLIAFPGLIPHISFVTLWQKDPGEDTDRLFQQVIELSDPDGTTLCRTQAKFQLKRRRHRLISIVNNVQIHRAGVHRIQVHLTDEEGKISEETLVKSFPIEVQQIQRPQTQNLN